MGKIFTSNKTVREAKEISAMLRKNREDRKKTKDFLTNERNITINKDNQILLNKLVEISSGKWSSVVPAPNRKRNQSVKVKGPTSLNMAVRKKETERIEKENHAFAKRLFDKQAVLNKTNLDKDWANHMKYKKQIQKLPKNLNQKKSMTASGMSTGHKRYGQLGTSQVRSDGGMGPMQHQDQEQWAM